MPLLHSDGLCTYAAINTTHSRERALIVDNAAINLHGDGSLDSCIWRQIYTLYFADWHHKNKKNKKTKNQKDKNK